MPAQIIPAMEIHAVHPSARLILYVDNEDMDTLVKCRDGWFDTASRRCPDPLVMNPEECLIAITNRASKTDQTVSKFYAIPAYNIK